MKVIYIYTHTHIVRKVSQHRNTEMKRESFQSSSLSLKVNIVTVLFCFFNDSFQEKKNADNRTLFLSMCFLGSSSVVLGAHGWGLQV